MLAAAIREQGRPVLLGSALVSVHQVLEVAVPTVIGVVIDRAVRTGDAASMGRWVVGLLVLFACLSAAGCIGGHVEERAVVATNHRLRTRIARRVLDPRGGPDHLAPGEVLSLTTVETTQLGDGVGTVVMGAGAVTGTLAGAAVLLSISLRLGLVVLIGLPVVLVAVQALTAPLAARADAHQAAVGRAAGVAADLLHGLRVLKGVGAEQRALAGYRTASGEALDAALAASRIRATFSGVTLAIAGTFLVVVAWVGGHQALDGDISVGQLVAALGVTQFLIGPLGRLAFTADLTARARAASARLGAVLVTDGSSPPALEEPPADASGLRLRGARRGSLAGLDLDVPAGQHLAVVALDPADAAALVAVLDRSAALEAGTIEAGGTDLATLHADAARARVVVGHHDAPLFEASLADEVGSLASSPALATASLAAASAADLDLERGLGERGRELSGGQRQRVALARALAGDPPVLVLHEPTTAIDASTEHHIAHAVRTLRRGRTTVVLTSSPTMLAAADRVVVLAGGEVVADGTHADLVRSDDRYRAAVLR